VGNPVSQFQIISKAPEDTALFYGQLFGWRIDADNSMGYRRIDTGSPEGIREASGRRRPRRRTLHNCSSPSGM
jgi:predicted enzyme related to lactoylglutathione lyase